MSQLIEIGADKWASHFENLDKEQIARFESALEALNTPAAAHELEKLQIHNRGLEFSISHLRDENEKLNVRLIEQNKELKDDVLRCIARARREIDYLAALWR